MNTNNTLWYQFRSIAAVENAEHIATQAPLARLAYQWVAVQPPFPPSHPHSSPHLTHIHTHHSATASRLGSMFDLQWVGTTVSTTDTPPHPLFPLLPLTVDTYHTITPPRLHLSACGLCPCRKQKKANTKSMAEEAVDPQKPQSLLPQFFFFFQ